MTYQELRNNEKASTAVKAAYRKGKITWQQAEWLMTGVKI